MRTNPKRDSESVWLRALPFSLGLLASFGVGCTIDLSDIPLLGSDASTRIDSGEDGGLGCDGVIDGTSCGTGRICLDEVCVTSTCGDGVVDRARGEECESPQANCVECVWSCDGGACDDGGARCLNDASMSEVELCDGLDNDCDGVIDEGAPVVFVDADMDGVGNSTMPVACTLGLGYSALGNDCNDADPNISPLKQEDCDTPADDNCNASVNEDCPCEAGTTQACGPTDGAGNPITEGECEQGVQTCVEGKLGECSGRGPTDETCDDADDDDDCDGQVDEGLYVTCFADADSDGFAAVDSAGVKQCGLACGALTTSVAPLDAATIDCNDERASAFPGATEACDGEDDDCDGVADNGALLTFYLDADGDGFGTPATTTRGCTAPTGYVANADDCADGAAAINPNATEVCDNIDNDCRNGADNGITCACTAPRDCGTPNSAGGIEERGRCAKGTQACANGMWGDCVGAVGPIAETCNMADDDCDGVIDNGVQITCYVDNDRDGFAATTTGAAQACQCAVGYTATRPTNASNTDCADNAANRRPAGLAETCDMVDNDCDTTVDEGTGTTCYADPDNDEYAIAGAATSRVCSGGCGTNLTARAPSGAGNIDCAENNANRTPGRAETCDSVDNDCDTTVDEGVQINCYVDNDGDGFAATTAGATQACSCGANRTATQPTNASNTDCADNASNRRPGLAETCDTVDNDCDTNVDENAGTLCYADPDNDEYAIVGAATSRVCSGGCGTNLTATVPSGANIDCAENNANRTPGRQETCDGVDNDCNGTVDNGFNVGTSCGVGACSGGVYECATASTTRCSRMPGGSDARNTVEDCDNVNDDCDGATDEGVNALCMGTNALQTCVNGTYTTTTMCAASNTTCINTMVGSTFVGGCTGECADGRYRCASATQSQECEDGVWSNDATCSAGTSPPTICDSVTGSGTYGRCIDNTPTDFGRVSSAGAMSLPLQHNDLIAQPIILPATRLLVGFGMTAGGSGGAVYYTLHHDSSGQPGTVMNQATSAVTLSPTGTNFRSRMSSTAAAITLNAGTRYWIVASFQVLGGESPSLYYFGANGAGGALRYGQATYPYLGSTLGLTEATTGEATLYIRVQR